MPYVSKLALASAVAQEVGQTFKFFCRIAPISVVAGLLIVVSAPVVSAAPPSAPSFGAPVPPVDPYNLTADQKAKITAIESSSQNQIAAIQSNPKLSMDQKAAKIAQLIDQGNVQRRALLNSKQQALFDSQRAQAKTQDPLHLTTLQQIKLQMLSQSSGAQTQALLANPNLSIDQKAKQLASAQVMAAHNQRRAQLNPDQQKIFDGLQAKMDASDPLHQTLFQRVKLKLLQRDGMAKMQAIEQSPTMTMPQKQAAAKALNSSVMAQMDAVLTPAQLKTVRAQQAAMAKQGH